MLGFHWRAFLETPACIAAEWSGSDACNSHSAILSAFVDSRYNGKRSVFARFLGVCWAATIVGQVYVSAQVAGVKPTLGGQPVLVQPTTVLGYKDCITNVTSSKCVGGNSIRAQAPFDPSTACPTDALYDATGQLISNDIIAFQVKAEGLCIHSILCP